MDLEPKMCPHCGETMEKFYPGPESGWDHEILICGNDTCAYFIRGRKKIAEENKVNFAYRFFFDPFRNKGGALAAWCGGNLSLLKGRCNQVQEG